MRKLFQPPMLCRLLLLLQVFEPVVQTHLYPRTQIDISISLVQARTSSSYRNHTNHLPHAAITPTFLYGRRTEACGRRQSTRRLSRSSTRGLL